MNKVLTILLMCLVLTAPAATNVVTFNFSDILSTSYSNRLVTLTPKSTPTVDAGSIVVSVARTNTTATNGVCLFTNLVPGTYSVSVSGFPVVTTFLVAIPTNQGALNAWAYTVTAPTNGNLVAWTKAASDARFVSGAGTNASLRTNGGLIYLDVTASSSAVTNYNQLVISNAPLTLTNVVRLQELSNASNGLVLSIGAVATNIGTLTSNAMTNTGTFAANAANNASNAAVPRIIYGDVPSSGQLATNLGGLPYLVKMTRDGLMYQTTGTNAGQNSLDFNLAGGRVDVGTLYQTATDKIATLNLLVVQGPTTDAGITVYPYSTNYISAMEVRDYSRQNGATLGIWSQTGDPTTDATKWRTFLDFFFLDFYFSKTFTNASGQTAAVPWLYCVTNAGISNWINFAPLRPTDSATTNPMISGSRGAVAIDNTNGTLWVSNGIFKSLTMTNSTNAGQLTGAGIGSISNQVFVQATSIMGGTTDLVAAIVRTSNAIPAAAATNYLNGTNNVGMATITNSAALFATNRFSPTNGLNYMGNFSTPVLVQRFVTTNATLGTSTNGAIGYTGTGNAVGTALATNVGTISITNRVPGSVLRITYFADVWANTTAGQVLTGFIAGDTSGTNAISGSKANAHDLSASGGPCGLRQSFNYPVSGTNVYNFTNYVGASSTNIWGVNGRQGVANQTLGGVSWIMIEEWTQ